MTDDPDLCSLDDARRWSAISRALALPGYLERVLALGPRDGRGRADWERGEGFNPWGAKSFSPSAAHWALLWSGDGRPSELIDADHGTDLNTFLRDHSAAFAGDLADVTAPAPEICAAGCACCVLHLRRWLAAHDRTLVLCTPSALAGFHSGCGATNAAQLWLDPDTLTFAEPHNTADCTTCKAQSRCAVCRGNLVEAEIWFSPLLERDE